MRKMRLLLCATLVAVGANAQYFQHVYGGTTRDRLESGVNANAGSPQGHIMTGYTDIAGFNNVMLTRTDLDGRLAGPPPIFNNRYQIFENSQPRDAKARSVVHPLACGGNISVWGDFGTNPGGVSNKFFYAQFTPAGVPVIAFSYAFPLTFPVFEVEATSMCISTSNPNNVFMCGWVRQAAGGRRCPVVISLDACTGNVNWTQSYFVGNNTDWIATDLVESPYPPVPPFVVPDIALCGRMTIPGAFETACFFKVSSAAPGGITALLREYGTPAVSAGGFDAIAIANNPFGSGPGFVFGGYYDNPTSGNADSWIIKTDPTGVIVDFTTLFDYNPPGNNNYAYDVIERFNTTAIYEYYLGGYVANGIFGGEDALVNKVAFNGLGVALGQFTYGGPGNERVRQLDQLDGYGLNNDGLSAYGTTIGSWPLVGNSDFYFVKAYFNGVQSPTCNYTLVDPPSLPGPGYIQIGDPRVLSTLGRRNLTLNQNLMSDWEICWAPNDPFGNNARLAQSAAAEQLTQPGYFPNPVSRDNAIVTVTFGKETVEGMAQMELWNSLGQLCWTKNVPVAKGQTNMQVELGNELTGGMYHLIVRQAGALNNYRILVE
jgi:hypothetical protein